MKIITGSTGTAHVTSNNDGEFNQGIFGSGLVVLKNGYQLETQIKDANTITIKDGDLVMQGRHALIEPGTTEDVTIMTGAVGMKRIDLIVARYTLDESTGYERITLEVITGEETEGTPVEPAYVQGDIRTGSLVAEMPLYKVNLNGINIESVVACFSVKDDLDSRISKIEQKGSITEGEWITRVVPANTPTNVATLTLNPNKKYLVNLNCSWVESYEVPQFIELYADGENVANQGSLMLYGYNNLNYIAEGITSIVVKARFIASGGTCNLWYRSYLKAIEL